jgi:hypothetical protein
MTAVFHTLALLVFVANVVGTPLPVFGEAALSGQTRLISIAVYDVLTRFFVISCNISAD